jgi:hypothetical protein
MYVIEKEDLRAQMKNNSCKLSEKLHPTIVLQGLNKYMTKCYSNRDTILYLRALSSARQ